MFLSATLVDLTNTYAGSASLKIGKTKVKEAITLTINSENCTGFVTGQVNSAHLGNVTVAGQINGKSLKLIGADAGRLLQVKIGKHGTSLSGSLFNGADDSKGKFKAKMAGDSVTSTSSAAAIMGGARARALSVPGNTGSGGLDPTIDPVTGLPIDPATGLPIDPSQTPGDTGDPTTTPPDPAAGGAAGGNAGGPLGAGAPGAGAPAPAGAPGTMIGNNFDFTGIWTAEFNNNGTGSIDDPNMPGATTVINGTRPGTDLRTVTYTVISQDNAGLVMGTVDVQEFGTFTFTGFVNSAHMDLALTGTSTGAVTGTMSLDFDPTTNFTTFNGQFINGVANTYVANGPINNGTFVANIPPPPVPLPTGTELYHVDDVDTNGDPTLGNFDPGNGSIGEDFAVGGTPIVINSLGAFDDNEDGLNGTIRVAIFNTSAPAAPIVVADITTANSGLAPGSAFRYLTTFTPVTLTTGVYRIVAFGYGQGDLAGDIGDSAYVGPPPVDDTAGGDIQYPISNQLNANNWVSNPNGGGGGGGGGLVYPTVDQGLPLNRYLAGSLLYDFGTVPPVSPGPPVVPPTTLTKPGNAAFPGGVYTGNNGQNVFGSQSGAIIPP